MGTREQEDIRLERIKTVKTYFEGRLSAGLLPSHDLAVASFLVDLAAQVLELREDLDVVDDEVEGKADEMDIESRVDDVTGELEDLEERVTKLEASVEE